VGKKLAD
jgi:DNA mismatch repair ATPase MutL